MDKEIKLLLKKEMKRQNSVIELIASENYVSKDVLKLCGSIFTNKYAEGYSGKRYYGGCKYIDEIENLAIYYATKLFNVKYANVQPHCGSSANMAVYVALLKKGDKIMGLNLSHGGHLTHGHKVNFSGQDYNVISYNVNPNTYLLDYDEIEKIAISEKPKLIIAGASAYQRKIDFKRFKEIADKCGAYLMVDMAHIAGLVASGLHENPCCYADVVTTTTHKTLRGPRGGLILTNKEEIIKKINKAIFPGIQGGPLMHIIAAKAQCFYEALQKDFREYQKQVLKNISSLSDELLNNGLNVLTKGTDNHLILVDVTNLNLTGKDAEEMLDKINIIVNKNTIPYDKLSPNITSGIRIGSPYMTTKGFNEDDFKKVGTIISYCLKKEKNNSELKKMVKSILNK